MQAALTYGADAPAGLIISSSDSRALRLYALHGFALRPTFDAFGTLQQRALPQERARVTEAHAHELGELAGVCREVRGAPYTRELRYAQSRGGRILRLGDRGVSVFEPGRVWMLAARDQEAAEALLWAALEGAAHDGDGRDEGEREPRAAHGLATIGVRWISAEQQWAIPILLRAGLALTLHGAIAVRGNPGTLHPYLPSAPFA